MTGATPWRKGSFHLMGRSWRVLFGSMYEDSDIERRAFAGADRVFCIASAGSTVMRLCGNHEVVACDINPLQLAYAERRIGGGPIELGAAERMMRFARAFLPLVGWHSDLIRSFLAFTDPSEQFQFWRKHLDTRRFRAGFDALMSRMSLRAVFAPQYLSGLPPGFGAVLRARLARGFTRHANATNPYAHALLAGETKNEPHEPLPTASRVQFVCSDAASHLESCPAGSFDAFALSNILDGAELSYRERLFSAVRRTATKEAVVVLRSFGEPPPDVPANHAEQDRAMLWGVVDVRRVDCL